MEQPEEFIVKGQEHKVCKLVKSLYSLKQTPKRWHKKSDCFMIEDVFTINEFDKCVRIKIFENRCIIVCLYADDMFWD